VPPADTAPRLVAEVFTIEDAHVAADAGADEVSLDLFLRHPTPSVSRVKALAAELEARGVVLRLRTPTIVRPGERRTVTFTLGSEDIQLLNQQMEWVVEPGEFEVLVGELKGILTVS
jgi:hypothetical protein